jgi:hypothetical protein
LPCLAEPASCLPLHASKMHAPAATT